MEAFAVAPGGFLQEHGAELGEVTRAWLGLSAVEEESNLTLQGDSARTTRHR